MRENTDALAECHFPGGARRPQFNGIRVNGQSCKLKISGYDYALYLSCYSAYGISALVDLIQCVLPKFVLPATSLSSKIDIKCIILIFATVRSHYVKKTLERRHF